MVAEKSISVSNLVNGTTRLQPIVLQIGQIAGLIASEAVNKNINTKQIDIRTIQSKFLDSGGYIQPFLDVEKNNTFFKAYQRIGSTGILRGTGLNVGWSNQTWFYPEKDIEFNLLKSDLADYYDLDEFPLSDLKINSVFKWISLISNPKIKNYEQAWVDLGLSNFDKNRIMKRGEFAIIVDYFLNPFKSFKVDFEGQLIHDEK